MATSIYNPIEFEFEYRMLQCERHLENAKYDYKIETENLCRLANERLTTGIYRGNEAIVAKAGRLLGLEIKIAELTNQYEAFSVLKEAHEQAIAINSRTAVTRYLFSEDEDDEVAE